MKLKETRRDDAGIWINLSGADYFVFPDTCRAQLAEWVRRQLRGAEFQPGFVVPAILPGAPLGVAWRCFIGTGCLGSRWTPARSYIVLKNPGTRWSRRKGWCSGRRTTSRPSRSRPAISFGPTSDSAGDGRGEDGGSVPERRDRPTGKRHATRKQNDDSDSP